MRSVALLEGDRALQINKRMMVVCRRDGFGRIGLEYYDVGHNIFVDLCIWFRRIYLCYIRCIEFIYEILFKVKFHLIVNENIIRWNRAEISMK